MTVELCFSKLIMASPWFGVCVVKGEMTFQGPQPALLSSRLPYKVVTQICINVCALFAFLTVALNVCLSARPNSVDAIHSSQIKEGN